MHNDSTFKQIYSSSVGRESNFYSSICQCFPATDVAPRPSSLAL